MVQITQPKARTIIRTALKHGRDNDFKPLAVVILDAGGHLKAFEREDGASFYRFRIAHGKAHAAIGMGAGSRALHERAVEQGYFVQALAALDDTAVVPVPGGVLVRDRRDIIIGAVGISGDNSDNDEAAVIAGIEAAGFTPDTGA